VPALILQDDVFLISRVLGEQKHLQLAFRAVQICPENIDFFLGQLSSFLIRVLQQERLSLCSADGFVFSDRP